MSKYGDLGVDVHKKGIEAFKSTKGIYEHAFCSIHPDPTRPGYGFVHHLDGAGSKPVQNYLNWKETGNIEAFRGMAQDDLAMNVNDVFCVGKPESGSFGDIVSANELYVPKDRILQIMAEDWNELFRMLKNNGIDIIFAGGETEDLPDQVRTLTVGGSIHTTYRLDSVITGEEIRPGDAIIGISSGGKANYEKVEAGYIMSNGLALARHCLMKKGLEIKYPEIYEEGIEYEGRFKPTDEVDGIDGTIGEEITRPTRLFPPIFKGVIENFGDAIHGIVHNTGGGNTKCLRIGKGIKYVKNNMPEPPPIFKLIKEEGKVSWREMFMDCNMGVGAEMQVDAEISEEVSEFIQKEFGIESLKIGECRRARGKNKLLLETKYGNFNYVKS